MSAITPTASIPANTPHFFHNESGKPTRMLCMCAFIELRRHGCSTFDPLADSDEKVRLASWTKPSRRLRSIGSSSFNSNGDFISHMELAAGWGGDCLLLAGRCCLAAVFAASASSKFRQVPAESARESSLPTPAAVELLVGVCETIGAVALIFEIYARLASALLAIFMVAISFAVLSLWSPVDPPPVRAQKFNGFVANIATVGGLIYLVAAGSGRLSLMQ